MYRGSPLKNFLEPAMFCHLAVLIHLCGEVGKVKDPRYMQNKKDPRISLTETRFGIGGQKFAIFFPKTISKMFSFFLLFFYFLMVVLNSLKLNIDIIKIF